MLMGALTFRSLPRREAPMPVSCTGDTLAKRLRPVSGWVALPLCVLAGAGAAPAGPVATADTPLSFEQLTFQRRVAKQLPGEAVTTTGAG